MRYNPAKIEAKWQKKWLREKTYEPDLRAPLEVRRRGRLPARKRAGLLTGEAAKKPFYNLMMFPYPSAEGLHVGNMYAFVGADIFGRFKRMRGFDVFEPIGLDGFGIHSENYALKIKKHPMDQAKVSEKNFYRQLMMIGNAFAWDERLETYDPDYYRWTQWIFIQMFKRGLAYRKKAAVNWCPSCKTVLADEQVLPAGRQGFTGECERCGTKVIKRELEQWFFRITDYAERLLKNLDKIDWSERVKIAQRNWIGRSEGSLIKFALSRTDADKKANADKRGNYIEVFTTRPDTLFGATYMVLSPEHPLIRNKELGIRNYEEIDKYIKEVKAKTEEERISEGKEKTGVELKGVRAINPANKEEIPIWIADYVLGHVGTGAIMAVPAHDSRDWEFAKKFDLPIREVINPLEDPAQSAKRKAQNYSSKVKTSESAYEGEGVLINSGQFDGVSSEKAKWEITKFVEGGRKTQYRLRDWLISRQRYWGTPIPLFFCENCAERIKNQESRIKERYNKGELENPGWIAVQEKDLPVKLPYVKNFRPTGTDKSPLAAVEKFYKVRCPKCKAWARRETDVSDTFLDSAWYYIGYLGVAANPKSQIPNSKQIRNPKFKIPNTPFSSPLIRKWLPGDMYVGGAEHAVLHLLYVRFLSMVFYDWSLVHFEEPFKKFRAHGLLIKDGAKMSKSRGNVVNPDEYIKAYGADALRMYLMFLGPFEQGGDFRDTGIKGITRFLERVWRLYYTRPEKSEFHPNDPKDKAHELNRIVHRTIKKVTEDIENLQYNTAISALMILLNEFEKKLEEVSREHVSLFLRLLAPFAPYMAEELYQQLFGNPKSQIPNPKQIQNPKLKNLKRLHSIHTEFWPRYNPKFVREENFELVIQVNGKVRGRITLPAGSDENYAKKEAMRLESIKSRVAPGVHKVVFVPNRLINFVV